MKKTPGGPTSGQNNHVTSCLTSEEDAGEARLFHRVVREEADAQFVGLGGDGRGRGAAAEGTVRPHLIASQHAGDLNTIVLAVLLENRQHSGG